MILETYYRWLVMVKAPEAGKTKTRMQPHLSPVQSVQLQTALTHQLLCLWQEEAFFPLSLWVGGDMSVFNDVVLSPCELDTIGKDNMEVLAQSEGDLGQRMQVAVDHAFKNEPHLNGIFITGTDCPFIDAQYLAQVRIALTQGHDVVIGPADDGGYVLIAMREPYPALFDDIDWGSDQVLSQTKQQIVKLGLNVFYLPSLSDIDLPSDLPKLRDCTFSALRDFAKA